MVVSIHEFAESSIYQEIAEEARRREIISLLRRAASLNFPEITIGPEIDKIDDLAALEDLCLTMHELPSAATLQARLAELIRASEARPSAITETS